MQVDISIWWSAICVKSYLWNGQVMETGVICPQEKLLLPAYMPHSDNTLGYVCKAEIDKLGTTDSQWVNNGYYLRHFSDFDSFLKMHIIILYVKSSVITI